MIAALCISADVSRAQDRGSEKYVTLHRRGDALCASVESFLNERLVGKADPERLGLALIPWQKVKGVEYNSLQPDWAQPAILEADIDNDGTSEIVFRRTSLRGANETVLHTLLVFSKESFPFDRQAELARLAPLPSWARWNAMIDLSIEARQATYPFWSLPGARELRPGQGYPPSIADTGLFELIQSNGRAYWLISKNRGALQPRDPDLFLLAEQTAPYGLRDKCYFMRPNPKNPRLAEQIKKYAGQ